MGWLESGTDTTVGMDAQLELMVTVVLAARDDRRARRACADLAGRLGGTVTQAADLLDEEPGCWSVTIALSRPAPADAGSPAALTAAVRGLIAEIAPGAGVETSCEPPTAWAVIDDIEVLAPVVSRGERLLVEVWSEPATLAPSAPPRPRAPSRAPAEPGHVLIARTSDFNPDGSPADGVTGGGDTGEGDPAGDGRPADDRLSLWLVLVPGRPDGARWLARAVAGRIVRHAEITEVIELDDMTCVGMDLGVLDRPPIAGVLAAVAALGSPGWTPVCHNDQVVTTRWVALPRPAAGVLAMEIAAGPVAPHPTVAGGRPDFELLRR